ncbi:MAG: phage virion morphogenesis protein [Rhizobiales bacterium]|nr:phage virion morphogenesis protein [Hyphomicrobiales bacterium]
MARAVVEIDQKGLDQALAALEGIERVARSDDLKSNIAQYLKSEALARFDSKQAPDGSSWAQSKQNPDTLRETGTLQRSILYQISGQDILVGTQGEEIEAYAAAQQWGVTIKPKNAKALAFVVGNKTVFAQSVTLPARPYIGFAPRDEKNIIQFVAEAIAGAINQAGGA